MEEKKQLDLRHVLGQSGEELAFRYLVLNDYIILARNFRCRIGEIDLIAAKDGILFFFEVKTRLSTYAGTPSESVTFAKQQKIRRVAEYYLMLNGLLENMPVLSFDVIEIIIEEHRVKYFKHYEHCF